ncbi:MAG TPA: sodium-dependent transporter [Methanocorpusculum sp.]|nr:sodium-dependent transporter [Methanocorpusculum sp.]
MGDGERGGFSGSLSFILTAAGTAVGLGCIWRFPYLTAEHGGGIFILCYVAILLTLGITLLAVEFAIGRKTGVGVLDAFGKLNPKFGFLGIICVLVCALSQPYFSVLGSCITKYGFLYLSGEGEAAAEAGFYSTYIASNFEPLLWLVLYIAVAAVIVYFGVQAGIERVCKIVMPIEVFLIAILAIDCLSLPGALDGLVYFLAPNFDNFTPDAVLAALGQVFYSLSLGLGVMVTFGSYLSKKVNVIKSSCSTVFFTFLVSMLAGALIVPASYLYTNGNPAAVGSGGMFESLPMVFDMMPFGTVSGGAFFILLSLAALTSTIAEFEVIVTALKDRLGFSRLKGVIIMSVYTLILGGFISLGYGALNWIQIGDMYLLEFFDFMSGTILMPLMVFFTCILVAYFVKPKVILDEMNLKEKGVIRKGMWVMLKFVCPACIAIIFITNIIGMF